MPPAAKHFDPLVGIDVHIIQPPGPVPPVPVPHPYTGMLMDPCDYAPYIGGTVKVGGLQRAQAGTGGISIPKHIPIGGVFVKPPADESEMFMGSSTVSVDGDAFSYLGLPALSCQCIGMPPIPRKKGSTPKSLVLPTTVCLSIPLPVQVGGGPTVSLMALGMRAGMAALGALVKKAKKAIKGKKGKGKGPRKGANGHKCNGAHPVDVITGANFDTFDDAREPAPRMFAWGRHYTTARHRERGPLGFGFRHGYAHTLSLHRQTFVFETPDGRQVPFDPLVGGRHFAEAHGHTLHRVDAATYEVRHRDDPCLVFSRRGESPVLHLSAIRSGPRALAFRRGPAGLETIVETGPEGALEYLLRHDRHGRIVEVARRSARGERRIAAYSYDRRGDLVASVDAAGGRHEYEYDDAHRWLRMREPRGYVFSWTYGEGGRCVEATGQDGLWWAKFDYDPRARITRVTERKGGVHVFRYDDNGTLRQLEDPYGGVLDRIVDDEDGRVLAEVDDGGRIVQWLYDGVGAHVGRRDHFGRTMPTEEEQPDPPDDLDPDEAHTQRDREQGTAFVVPSASSLDLADTVPDALRPLATWALDPSPVPAVHAQRQHDALGRPTLELDDRGRRRVWQYDASGNAVAYQDRDGRVFRQEIASWNLVGAEIDALGHTARYRHGPTELLTEVVDPLGNVSRYEYDEKDRLVSVHRHGRTRESYEWDRGDRLVAKRDADGNLLQALEYGEHDLPIRCELEGGEEHRFAYDLRGRILEASTPAHRVRLHRDPNDRPRYDRRDGRGVAHVYVTGKLRRTAVLQRFVTRYRFDTGRGVCTLVDPTGRAHSIHLDAHGRRLRTHASGTRELTRFDDEGRCQGRVRWSAGETRAIRFGYSHEGDLLEAYDSVAGHTRYSVDAAHRLVGEDGPHGSIRYVLDAAGNLCEGPGLHGVVLDEGNRIRRVGGEEVRYDARDRIASRGAVRYRYDALDRLVAVEDDAHAEAWTATYDALGRRVRSGRGDAQTELVWDHERLAAEIAPDGRLRVYVYADETALVPILFVDYASVDADPASGRVHAIFTDQIGVPVRVEDDTGRAVWSARVEPYGRVHVDPGAQIELALRWPGHYHDAETGLHYNWHRYYDPALGRYLQPDPLGQFADLNVYAYPDNPLVRVDLCGLHPKKTKANKARKAGTEAPKKKGKVKTGEVESYGAMNKRAVVGDKIDHDHIPAYAAVRDAINNQLKKQGKKKLTKKQKAQLKKNLTTVAVPHKVHAAGRTYAGKGGPARQADDAADLKKATNKDLAETKKNLEKNKHDPKSVDKWAKDVDKRNKDIGLYDKPIPDDLWKTDMTGV